MPGINAALCALDTVLPKDAYRIDAKTPSYGIDRVPLGNHINPNRWDAETAARFQPIGRQKPVGIYHRAERHFVTACYSVKRVAQAHPHHLSAPGGKPAGCQRNRSCPAPGLGARAIR